MVCVDRVTIGLREGVRPDEQGKCPAPLQPVHIPHTEESECRVIVQPTENGTRCPKPTEQNLVTRLDGKPACVARLRLPPVRPDKDGKCPGNWVVVDKPVDGKVCEVPPPPPRLFLHVFGRVDCYLGLYAEYYIEAKVTVGPDKDGPVYDVDTLRIASLSGWKGHAECHNTYTCSTSEHTLAGCKDICLGGFMEHQGRTATSYGDCYF